MTHVIHNALNTINQLLDEQKELLAPKLTTDQSEVDATLREIISTATRYAFESDDSVCLKGPIGALWVFKDGTYTGISEEPGTNGYPAYLNPAHLVTAKELALKYLGKF